MSSLHTARTLPDTAGFDHPEPRVPSMRMRGRIRGKVVQDRSENRDLKWGIWAYFLLLIFEGALRKWFLPGLATPLLVIRDPIALGLVVVAYSRNLLPISGYLVSMAVIGLLGIVTAVTVGHGNLFVAIYGARVLLLHMPLMFVIGRIFGRDDILKMGKATLWIAIPMTVLIGLQFYSPQSAWVNRGVGGDSEGVGFSGAMGFFRPPGTFSFTNGTSLFYGFVAPFVFYFGLNLKLLSRLLMILSVICLVAAVPISISRTLLFEIALSAAFTIVAISRKPEYFGRMLVGVLATVAALALLGTTSFFDTASQAFTQRFESANTTEGGLDGVFLDRFLGGMIKAIAGSGDQPIFGYGQGMGSNVGGMLLAGQSTFLIAEEEWGRAIGELGPIIGLMLIGIRVAMTVSITHRCYIRLVEGDLLPWILLSFAFFTLAQGSWAQPTSLGFCVMTGGLTLASLKRPLRKANKIRKLSVVGNTAVNIRRNRL